MARQIKAETSAALAILSILNEFAEPSCLLPGESRQDYAAIRRMVIDDIQPKTNLELLLTLDLVELSWEILRYRRLKQKILEAYRQNAVEALLRRLDGEGMPGECLDTIKFQARRNAIDWRDDPAAAAEIEGRFERNGFDAIAINAEVFVQAEETFGMFDRLMQSAQHRRLILLREISARKFR